MRAFKIERPSRFGQRVLSVSIKDTHSDQRRNTSEGLSLTDLMTHRRVFNLRAQSWASAVRVKSGEDKERARSGLLSITKSGREALLGWSTGL